MTDTFPEQPQLAIRSRTNAALVFGFHADLRRVPTRSETPLKRPRRSHPAGSAEEVDETPGRFGMVGQIAKWVAMLAAIAAPWLLLLTG